MRRLAYSSVVRLTWQHSAASLPRIFKRSQIADSARAAMVPDGDVHRAQNAQFRMMLLRGFRLEWLRGREENRTEQVGRSARCGLAGVWVLQDPSICGPARRVRQG